MNPNEEKPTNSNDQQGLGTAPVMDVQPPQTTPRSTNSEDTAQPTEPEVTTSEDAVTNEGTAQPENSPEISSDNSAEVATEPQANSTPDSTEGKKSENDNQEAVPSADNTAIASSNPMAVNNPSEHKKKGRKLVVILAVLIVLALSGLAVFLFLSKDDSNKTTSQADTNNQTQNQVTEAVTTQDVDDATNEVDTQLNSVDDSADFATTDLADNTLGL